MLGLDYLRGPFVQNATTNSIEVIWETSEPCLAFVEYGPTSDLGMAAPGGGAATHHRVTLRPLNTGVRYFYRVISLDGRGCWTTPVETFATLKPSGPITFAVISDTAQTGAVLSYSPQSLLAGVLNRLEVDLVMHLGDIVAMDFNPTNVQAQFFDIFQPVIRRTPFYLLLGNHDLFPPSGGALDLSAPNFHKAFSLPTNAMDGTSRYYSFDHGDVHFVCLFNPWFYVYDFHAQTDQYRWLTNDLARSQKPWKLLFCHAPIETSSLHAADDYNWNGMADQMELFNLITPLAGQYGVQLVFSGHDHSLHRYVPFEGLHGCVAAGGGQTLYPFAFNHPNLARYWQTYHCVKVAVTGDTMTLEAYDVEGTRFDSWTVQRDLPARRLYEASWHSPVVAAGAADDGDGNVCGQSFGFSGAPIYPRAGHFSNLGRVFVNNDSNHLYIGLDQVMIRGDQNLFLFLESPRCAGVTTMAGVGNGRIDPEGEGVDGLDCLENLAFAHFAPCVGCMLGDEYADGQFRSFARTNLGLNIGQGIFRLDKGLSEVPGARLQQFNLSPQTGSPIIPAASVLLEQNADFIQAAIPFEALGGLRPGDRIRLGVLVGGPEYDPVSQTRWIDSSVLGYSLTGSGRQQVVLEGLSVELALPRDQDSDQDGFYDWQEELAGTDPQDAQSALRIRAIPVASGHWLLSWQSVPGKRYQLEIAADGHFEFVPAAEWGFPVIARSTNEHHLVRSEGIEAGKQRFYRIRLMTD